MATAGAGPDAGRSVTAFGRLAGRMRATVEWAFGDPAFRAKLRFLRGILLFRDLKSRDLARLVKKMMEKTYGPGEVVFHEGHLGRAFFIVAEGKVDVLRRRPDNDELVSVAAFEPGDFFGEMVLLDELPRSATCRALETTRLLVLYKDHFDRLRVQSPRAAAVILHALARLLSARLRRERRQMFPPPDPSPR